MENVFFWCTKLNPTAVLVTFPRAVLSKHDQTTLWGPVCVFATMPKCQPTRVQLSFKIHTKIFQWCILRVPFRSSNHLQGNVAGVARDYSIFSESGAKKTEQAICSPSENYPAATSGQGRARSVLG